MRRCWLYVMLVCEICCCLLDTSCQYIMQAADNTLHYSGPQCREILLMSCSSVCDQLQSRHQVYQQSQDWLLISIKMIQLLFWDEHLFSHIWSLETDADVLCCVDDLFRIFRMFCLQPSVSQPFRCIQLIRWVAVCNNTFADLCLHLPPSWLNLTQQNKKFSL